MAWFTRGWSFRPGEHAPHGWGRLGGVRRRRVRDRRHAARDRAAPAGRRAPGAARRGAPAHVAGVPGVRDRLHPDDRRLAADPPAGRLDARHRPLRDAAGAGLGRHLRADPVQHRRAGHRDRQPRGPGHRGPARRRAAVRRAGGVRRAAALRALVRPAARRHPAGRADRCTSGRPCSSRRWCRCWPSSWPAIAPWAGLALLVGLNRAGVAAAGVAPAARRRRARSATSQQPSRRRRVRR